MDVDLRKRKGVDLKNKLGTYKKQVRMNKKKFINCFPKT